MYLEPRDKPPIDSSSVLVWGCIIGGCILVVVLMCFGVFYVWDAWIRDTI